MTNPNRVGHIAGNILSSIMYIYLLPAVMVFAPYYNWQYAKENGFVRWLVLGEIVPTIKAFGWPYFVFIKKRPPPPSSWTEDEKTNSKHLIAAFDTDLEAVKLSNARGPGIMPHDEVVKILALEKTALMEAKLVEDNVLNKVHPQMTHHFKTEFIPLLELKIQNLETSPNNLSLNMQIDALEDKWVTWFNSNKDGIYIPK